MQPAVFGDAQLGSGLGARANSVAARDEDEQIAAANRRAKRDFELRAWRQVLMIEKYIDCGALQGERDPVRELTPCVRVANEDLHGQ